MQTVSETVVRTSTFAVNEKTGVLFPAHTDMFACPDPVTRRYIAPNDLIFFSEEKAAKELSDSITRKLRAESGLKTDSASADSQTSDDHKLPHRSSSKADVAKLAKEKWGVTLHENRTRANLNAQWLAASVAAASGVNVQGAVDAQASAEGDQLAAA